MSKYLWILIVPLVVITVIGFILLMVELSKKNVRKSIKTVSYEEDDEQLKKIDLNVWKKIIKIIIKDPVSVIMMIISSISLSVLDIFTPLLNAYALENFFSKDPNFDNRYIFYIIYGLLAILTGVIIYFFIKTASTVEERTTYQLRKEAFQKLQKLSFSYYDTNSSGWIMARMTSDARKLSSIISWGLVDLLWGSMLMVGILIASFIIQWQLALIILTLLPAFLLFAFYYERKILNEYRDVRKINSAVTQGFSESFMGANTSKTLVIEDDNLKNFIEVSNKMRKRSIKAAFFSSLFWPTILVIGYLGVSIVSGLGSDIILNQNSSFILKVSSLYLFIDYTIRFIDPVLSISRVISEFQQAEASAERVIELIEKKPDIEDSQEVIEKYGDIFNEKVENYEQLKGKIEFKDVSFQYKGTNKLILENFNLTINQGESVAFVGETGSGKSTIINLICRFYEPTQGQIFIDDLDYRERSLSWLHRNLGYVLQTPYLFSSSIKENIKYGKLDATDEEVIAAAKLVNADEFILKLENGYDTLVGESGNKLSIGQKQLISFARAIISNPKILVLDEATSSIDTENEKIIQDSLKKLLVGRTSLVVAHRLSTIVDANKIIVLKHGEIVEAGTHTELLHKKGYYFNLYKTQFLQDFEKKNAI